MTRNEEEFILWWHSLTPEERIRRRREAAKYHDEWRRARREVLFGVLEKSPDDATIVARACAMLNVPRERLLDEINRRTAWENSGPNGA